MFQMEGSLLTCIQTKSKLIFVCQAEQKVMNDREAVEGLREQVKTLQEECEVSVGEMLGPLEETTAALETLQLPDITALRAIKTPPKNLKLLMEAICLMKVGTKAFIYYTEHKI